MLEYLLAKLIKKARLRAIRESRIAKTSKVEAGSEITRSTMGPHSFCGYNCVIINTDIGSYCSIANSVAIGLSEHPLSWISTSPVFYEGKDSVKTKYAENTRVRPLRTTIQNDVWIGERSMIRQGVTIGNGAVVGMNSVVTRDVPPFAIVAGSPARIIRKRFADDLIEKINLSAWWSRSPEVLRELGSSATDVNEFLNRLNTKMKT
jgi:acetyltransferase-like isoleucine patch superfamily enzyme